MVHVIYIAGFGRSGSTLVERLLEPAGAFASMGELRHFWTRVLAERSLCGCGRTWDACDVWASTMARIHGDTISEDLILRLANRSRRVDRTRNVPRIAFDLGGPMWLEERNRHVDAAGAMIRAFASSTGRDWIIDASKEASHGFLVARAKGVRLHVLHLVRDARGVAHSWTRARRRHDVRGEKRMMARRDPALSAWRWTYQNVAAEALRSVAHGYARIRYEDVVADPVRTLTQALERLGVPQDPSFRHVEGCTATLVPGHGVAGNPMRFRHDPVRLRLDEAWREELPTRDRARVTAITWPLLVRYGYRV